MNFFVSGETASGKTTLMNALMTFITPPTPRSSASRTRPKCRCRTPTGRARSSAAQMSQGGGSVDMFSLLKAALRQRPNEIIIGEIRGEEGNIAFQAMMTGHAVCADLPRGHSREADPACHRHPISVPRTYVDNLNVVIIAQRRAAAQRQDGAAHPQHLRDHRLRPGDRTPSPSSRSSAGTRRKTSSSSRPQQQLPARAAHRAGARPHREQAPPESTRRSTGAARCCRSSASRA